MTDPRPIRFLAVGVLNTAVGLSLIFGAKEILGMGDVGANALGYALAMILGFALNRQWTFRHRGDAGAAFARYLLVLLAAYAANLATVLCAIGIARVPGHLAQIAGVLPYTLTAWLGSRYWAFAGART